MKTPLRFEWNGWYKLSKKRKLSLKQPKKTGRVRKLAGIDRACRERRIMMVVKIWKLVGSAKNAPKNRRKKMSTKCKKRTNNFHLVFRNQSTGVVRIGWNAFYRNQLFQKISKMRSFWIMKCERWVRGMTPSTTRDGKQNEVDDVIGDIGCSLCAVFQINSINTRTVST